MTQNSLLNITIEGLIKGTLQVEEVKQMAPCRGKKKMTERTSHFMIDKVNGEKRFISKNTYNECLQVMEEHKKKMIEDYIEENEEGGGLLESEEDEVVFENEKDGSEE